MNGLTLDGDTLRFQDAEVGVEAVEAVVERWSARRGALLELRGPGWFVEVGEGYGALRRQLRERLRDRPWSSDWSDGRFPVATPLWLQGALGLAVLFVIAGTGWLVPLWGAALAPAGAWWWAASCRQRVEVTATGMRVGSAWERTWGWAELTSVSVERRGPRSRVFVHGEAGGSSAEVPTVLLPALTARVRRLGALEVSSGQDALDARYGARQRLWQALPWALGLAALVGAPLTPAPWQVLTVGLVVSAIGAALAMLVRERAQGWELGTLLYATLAYGALLGGLSLYGRGWLTWPLS